jgi:hypothetical protein
MMALDETGRCVQCASQVDDVCDGKSVNLCPRHRCGSYPLMYLAADFGVEYGDVLLWADYLRRVRIDAWSSPKPALNEQALGAYRRITQILAPASRLALTNALSDHANRRWGVP